MKRKTLPIALFALVLSAGLTPVAQAHGPEGDPGARIEKHMQMAAERLQLSDAQKQQLRPLVEEHVAKVKAIRGKYPPEMPREQKRQMYEEMHAVREDYDAEVKAVLTEEQQQEWEKMRSERRDRMREHQRERKAQEAT
jgi:protein CpxP